MIIDHSTFGWIMNLKYEIEIKLSSKYIKNPDLDIVPLPVIFGKDQIYFIIMRFFGLRYLETVNYMTSFSI